MKRKITSSSKPLKKKSNTITKITKNQLLKYTLDKQGLLERKKYNNIKDFGVLHCTNQTTPFLSLLARVKKFDGKCEIFLRETVDADEKKPFFRLRCMRGTLHILPVDKMFILDIYRKSKRFLSHFERYGIDDDKVEEYIGMVKDVIEEHGPQTSVTIKKLVGKRLNKNVGTSAIGIKSVVAVILNYGAATGKFEFGIEKNPQAWRGTYRKYGNMKTEPQFDEDMDELFVKMTEWYFELYGPSSFEDYVWWTGLAKTPLRKAFNQIKNKLSSVFVDDLPEELYILKSELPSLTETDEEINMVRFLPYEDALLKAYKATRHRFYGFTPYDDCKDEFEDRGVAYPTVWLNGRVIGRWEWSNKKHQPITINLLPEFLTENTKSLLTDELHSLSTFLESSSTIYKELKTK